MSEKSKQNSKLSADDDSLFEASVQLEKLPVAGRNLKLELSQSQLKKIARELNVTSVDEFSAQLNIIGIKGGVLVTGKLFAIVTQPCVVTLQPVQQQIKLQLERVFSPRSEKTQASSSSKFQSQDEIHVDMGSSEPEDEYEGPILDLVPFLLESIGLEIDLYPKAPGAAMDLEQAGDDPAELLPFSALKKLKSDT